MRKGFFLFILALAVIPLQSFHQIPRKFFFANEYKAATSTGQESLYIQFNFDANGDLTSIDVRRASDCFTYLYFGYTGSVGPAAGGHHYADNIVIDLDGGETFVTVNGLLTAGLPPCES